MPCFQDCPRRILHSYIKQTFQLLTNITLDLSQPNDYTIHNTARTHQLFNIVYYKIHRIHTSICKKEGRKSICFHRFMHISPHLCAFLRLGHVSTGQDMQIKLQYGLAYNLCGKIWFLWFAHIFCTFQSTIHWLSLFPYPTLIAVHPLMELGKQTHDHLMLEDQCGFCPWPKCYQVLN